MSVVQESKQSQIAALLGLCTDLKADVRSDPERNYFTVTVTPPWNIRTQQPAMELQNKIKEWSKRYPDVVCYSYDPSCTLLYIL